MTNLLEAIDSVFYLVATVCLLYCYLLLIKLTIEWAVVIVLPLAAAVLVVPLCWMYGDAAKGRQLYEQWRRL